jgi:cathepsin L
VKNEGQCDAGWAFAATGLVESDHAIRAGTLLSLSEQELLDCTGSGSGCGGGSPIDALRTVIAKGGLATESSYPYTARIAMCKAVTAVATIPGAGRVPSGDEVSLKAYVAQGPVLALIDASHPSFDFYPGGVYSEPACRTDRPTRAVLIVGYGTLSGQDYWIVKNSFGASWGAQGYIFMSRNNNNNCGIASFALAASNDPLPPPRVPAIPMLSGWALGVLLLAFAALGFLMLRRRAD